MGLFDGLDINKMRKAVEDGARKVQDGVTSGKVLEAVGDKAKKAQDGIANVNSISLDGLATGVFDMGKKAVYGAASAAADLTAAGKDAIGKAVGEASAQGATAASDNREVISLLWFLAHADGSVSDEEKTSMSQIAPLMDEAYDTYAVDLAGTCEARMAASAKEFGAANAPKIEAGRIIDAMDTKELNGKLLCWNMLALADSDGIDEAELDYVRYVSERTNVERSVFEELVSYRRGIEEIEASKEELKSSTRSYAEIEPLVSDFSDRQMKLVEAAQALVSDR